LSLSSGPKSCMAQAGFTLCVFLGDVSHGNLFFVGRGVFLVFMYSGLGLLALRNMLSPADVGLCVIGSNVASPRAISISLSC
jgi:hypothetical protein